MVINTNIAALTSAGNLNKSTSLLNQSLSRLSSGSKISSPADDPAGLAESITLNAQIGETTATNNNINNAVAFGQTQDGYLQQVSAALNEMATLAVEAQDGTKTDTERADYQKEFSTLSTYIADVATKDFNGVSLFSAAGLTVGTDTSGGSFQMTGIAGDYINTPVTTTTTTTSTVGYAADTPLTELSSAFASRPNGDQFIVQGSSTGYYRQTFAGDTIADMVNFFNSTGGQSSASYNAATGQLSITAAPGNSVTERALNYGNDNLFNDLGFGLPGALDSLSLYSSEVDNTSGSSPVTITTTLTHSVTSTSSTTTTPSGTPDISTVAGAQSALTTVTAAISQLATDRATIGANLERLNYVSQGLSTLKTNLSAANSEISDVDVAEESTAYAKQQILVQSATSMLAQANSAPQSILKLLQ